MKTIGTSWQARLILSLAIGLAHGACGDNIAPSEPDAGTGDGLTYWQDVAPIYFESCVTCHREGGIGQFRLDNYEDAKRWAPAAAAAVSSRIMPPWLVVSDGSCGDFRDSPALSDEEIDTIVAWAEGSALEGEPRTDLQVPATSTLEDGVELAIPEFVPELQENSPSRFDEYRCFLLENPLEQDAFMTAYQVIPGNTALVHHVVGMTLDPDTEIVGGGQTNRERIEQLDAESPDRPGYPCYGGAGEGTVMSTSAVVWGPGLDVAQYPPATGIKFATDDLFVVQIHYNLANPDVLGQSDRTIVRLRFEETVERPAIYMTPDVFLGSLVTGMPDTLPPGQESYTYTWEIKAADLYALLGVEKLDLYGVNLHMHELGVSMRFSIEEPAGEACMAYIPRWDFNWQYHYNYQEPVPISREAILRVSCEYDTSEQTEPVLPGWSTNNEMCMMGWLLVP